jgi:mono/diheme cytochrome c family protein
MLGRQIRVWAAIAGLAGATTVAGCTKPQVQGWNAAQAAAWANADQGSRLMPLAWMKALEQPDTPGAVPSVTPHRFLDTAYLANFRMLPPLDPQSNPLPIGFAADTLKDDSALANTSLHWLGKPAAQDYVPWVGLTCAACHTAQLNYGGKSRIVWGAPSLFDYQSLIEAVDAALGQTRAAAAPGAPNAARWDRFAKAVLGADDNPVHRQALLAAVDRLITWEATAESLNHTDLRYGFGRVDAIGHIFNRILMFGGAGQTTPNPADAPVSYPHLWNITLEKQVQWDGIATNDKLPIGKTPTDFGAIGRNVGEVLGVLGEAVPHVPSGPFDLKGFATSAQVDTLNAIEVQLTKLQPPAWPHEFGEPGAIKVADASGRRMLSPAEVLQAGKAIFATKCATCHTSHIAQGGTYETMRTFDQLGPENRTDEWMACNAWADTGNSGALAGVPLNYVSGAKTAAVVPVRQLLATTVKASLVNKAPQFADTTIENVFGITPLPNAPRIRAQVVRPLTPKEQRLQFCLQNSKDPLMAYKARPLEGIWATAPYLHNGSVPSLYDLLLPPAQRPATFYVGTRNFDPKRVGYDTSRNMPNNSFRYDTSLPGNSNKGHVYGVGSLSVTQRAELLEYLKSI